MDAIEQLRIQHMATWRDRPDEYWFLRLTEEMGELAASLAGRHEHQPELELAEIASICMNWRDKRRFDRLYSASEVLQGEKE